MKRLNATARQRYTVFLWAASSGKQLCQNTRSYYSYCFFCFFLAVLFMQTRFRSVRQQHDILRCSIFMARSIYAVSTRFSPAIPKAHQAPRSPECVPTLEKWGGRQSQRRNIPTQKLEPVRHPARDHTISSRLQHRERPAVESVNSYMPSVPDNCEFRNASA